jgi:hypothetical protein
VWIAVDVASGDYAVGAPGRKVVAARVPQQPFVKGHGGAVDTFTFRYPTLDMVYVHPGHGVWLLHGVGGTPSSNDGQNDGHYETGVNVGDAISLLPEGEAKPKEFVAGGTLVAVDVLSYEAFALRLTGAQIGGAQ